MDIIHDPLIKERNITVNFPELVESLDLALKDPSQASKHIKSFESKAFEIYLNAEQSVEWLNKQESSGFINESLLSSFRISSLLIIERYNELNYNTLKGLLYLCVLGHDIGKTVISIACNTEITNDICDILIEVINPLLELYDNFSFELKRTILVSFSKLPVIAKLSNCLQPIIQYVISDIIKNPWNTQLYDLFVLLTIDEDNLYDISHYPISKYFINQLIDYEIKHGMISKRLHTQNTVVNGGENVVLESFDSIIGIIKIMTNCILNCDVSVVSNFCNLFLIPNLKYLIGERLPTTRLNLRQSLLAHYLLKLLFSIMKINDDLLDELCNGFYIFDLLLVPLKEFEPNIYILSSALELICYILLNPSTTTKYCNILIEEFSPSTLINNINTEDTGLDQSNMVNGVNKSNMLNGVTKGKMTKEIGTTNMKEVDSNMKLYNEMVDREKYLLKMYNWYYKFISTLLYLSNTNFNLKEYVDDKLLSHELVTKVTVNNVIILTLYPNDKIDSNIVNQLLQMIDSVPSMGSNLANGVINSIVLTLVKRVDLINFNYENVYKIIQLLLFTYNNPSSDPQDHVDLIHPVEIVSSNIVNVVITFITENFNNFLKFNSIVDDNLMILMLKCMKNESKRQKDIYIETSVYKSYTQLINLCIYNNMLKYNSRQFFRLLFFYNYVILNDDQRNDSFDLIKYINNINLDNLFHIEYNNVDITNGKLEINSSDKFKDSITYSYSHPIEDLSYFESNMKDELSLIVTLEIVDKLLLYISPLYSIHFIHYYNERRKKNINSEYWAGLIKGYKLTYEQFNVINEKEIVNRLLQFNDNPVFVDESNYFKLISTEILRSNLYEDVQINTSYIVSLYLRMLNNVMKRDEQIKMKLKNPNFIRNLIKLTANHNIFDNHLTVKLIQFFIQLLKYDNHLIVESMDIIIIYDIITNFLQMIFMRMMTELNIENIISNDNIQKLLLYSSEFLLLITEQIGLVKFSETYEIQIFFVDICINKFISNELITELISILNVIHFYNHIHTITTAETASSDSNYQVGQIITSIVINIMYILISIIRNEDYKYLIINNLLKNENTVILTIIIHEIKLNDSKQHFQLQLLNRDTIQRVILFNYISFITNLEEDLDPRTSVLCITNDEIYLINSENTSVMCKYIKSEVKLFNINKGLFYLLLYGNYYLLFFINNNNHPITMYDAQDLVLEHKTPILTKSKDNSRPKHATNTSSSWSGIMCEYEDKLAVLIDEDDWIGIYNVDVTLLIKYIYPELVEDKIILTNFLIPKYELKEKPPTVDPLALVQQIVINNINKVEFNVNYYSVTLTDKESTEEVDLNLINFYNFESFKNLLYNKLYKTNNIWKRLLRTPED